MIDAWMAGSIRTYHDKYEDIHVQDQDRSGVNMDDQTQHHDDVLTAFRKSKSTTHQHQENPPGRGAAGALPRPVGSGSTCTKAVQSQSSGSDSE